MCFLKLNLFESDVERVRQRKFNIFELINFKLHPRLNASSQKFSSTQFLLSKDLQSIKSIALQLNINLSLITKFLILLSFILADHRHQSESISSTEVQKMNENEITSSTSQLSSSQTLALIYALLFSCCRYYVYL